MKRAYQSLKGILPSVKLLPYLIDSLKSKNSRSRMECLEEIAIIMDQTSMEAFPMDAACHFVEHVFDKDSSIAKLAESILSKIYSNDPSQFWKRVGDISEVRRQTLEEKFAPNTLKTPEKRISKQITSSSLLKTRMSPASRLSSRQRGDNTHASANDGKQTIPSPSVSRESMRTSLPEPDIADFKLDMKEVTVSSNQRSSSKIPVVSKNSSFRRASVSNDGKSSPRPSSETKNSESTYLMKEQPGLNSPLNKVMSEYKEESTVKTENDAALIHRYHRRSRSKSFDALTSLETDRNDKTSSQDGTPAETMTNNSSISLDIDKKGFSLKTREVEPARIIELLSSNENDAQIEGCKSFCLVLQSPTSESLFLPESSRITEILLDRIHNVFDTCTGDEANIRRLKYLLNALMQICLRKSFVALLDPQISLSMLDELLTRLLSTHIPLWKDGNQVVRALNLLVLKILENSDRTSLYSVLFELLSKQEDSSPRQNGETCDEEVQKKISLIVKCISKLSKTGFSSVNVAVLLRDIHVYLTSRCAKKGKKQNVKKDNSNESSDAGFQIVTALLGDLVKCHGTKIWDFASLVPLETKPQLSVLIQEFLDGKTVATDSCVGQVLQESPEKPSVQYETLSRESLGKIFERISTKEYTKRGLRELYEYRQLYPDVDLTPYLDATSFVFREYIEKGLESISLEDQQKKGNPAGTINTSLSYDVYSQKLEELERVSSSDNSSLCKTSSSYRERFSAISSRDEEDSFRRSNSREIFVNLS